MYLIDFDEDPKKLKEFLKAYLTDIIHDEKSLKKYMKDKAPRKTLKTKKRTRITIDSLG